MSAGNILDENEDLVKLLSDDELHQASKSGHELQRMISSFLEDVRPKTIEKLQDLLKDVEKSYNHSRWARIVGASATIGGSVLAITGFGLSFVTFGGSLVLTVVGSAFAAAGGITIGGAEIGYLTVSQKKLNDTKRACLNDNEEMRKIEIQGREFSDHVDSLATKYPMISKEAILHLLKHAWDSSKPAFKFFYSGYKLIDGASDVGRNAITVTKTVRAGVQAGARTVYFGLGTVGRVFSIGSVVLDVLFIPIDFIVLVKSAHDVYKYKKGKSSSDAATSIRNIIEELERNNQELIRVKDQLPGAACN